MPQKQLSEISTEVLEQFDDSVLANEEKYAKNNYTSHPYETDIMLCYALKEEGVEVTTENKRLFLLKVMELDKFPCYDDSSVYPFELVLNLYKTGIWRPFTPKYKQLIEESVLQATMEEAVNGPSVVGEDIAQDMSN